MGPRTEAMQGAMGKVCKAPFGKGELSWLTPALKSERTRPTTSSAGGLTSWAAASCPSWRSPLQIAHS